MRKKVSFAVLWALLLFIACSKSDPVNNNNSDTQKEIQGSWLVTENNIVYYDSANNILNQQNLDIGNIWTFNNDSISTVRYGTTIGAAYNITSAKTMSIVANSDTDYADITTLTDSSLAFSVTDTVQNSFGTPPVISNHNIIKMAFKKVVTF